MIDCPGCGEYNDNDKALCRRCEAEAIAEMAELWADDLYDSDSTNDYPWTDYDDDIPF